MAPSCVNTAAMRALMPRSSTLGAASARYFDDARRRNVDMSVPRLRDCSGGNESKQRAAPTVWVVAGQHAERDGAGEELEEQRKSVRAVQREAPRVEPLANLL